MTDKAKVITSPVGNVLFANVKTPRKNSFTGRMEHSVRFEVEQSTTGADTFKKQMSKINKNLIVDDSKDLSKEGNYIINGRSGAEYAPKVFDKDMQQLTGEDIPMLSKGTTARLLLTAFDGKNGKPGGVNLAGIQLIEVNEYQGTSSVDEETLLQALKANS